MQAEWLIVGLGNPGAKYETTWHNLGFMALEILQQRWGFRCNRLKFKGLCGEARIGGTAALFLLPQTFMNLSGESVREALNFYKLPPERLLVLCDDFDLPLGRVRLRSNGSAGTHNGLRSIVQCLGSDQFARLRIGFGPKPPEIDIVNYVLMKIAKAEREAAWTGLNLAADAVEILLRESLAAAQAKVNGAAERNGRHPVKETGKAKPTAALPSVQISFQKEVQEADAAAETEQSARKGAERA